MKTKPKYDADTIRRLKLSIAHWNRHATGKALIDESVYSYDCALCLRFAVVSRNCKGCPVMAKTGQRWCHGGPWKAAERLFKEKKMKQSAAFRKAAAKMRDFLKGLL